MQRGACVHVLTNYEEVISLMHPVATKSIGGLLSAYDLPSILANKHACWYLERQ